MKTTVSRGQKWSCWWYQKQNGTCEVAKFNGTTNHSVYTVWWREFWTCVV